MFLSKFLVVFAFVGVTQALYTWDSPECQALEPPIDPNPPPPAHQGCVAPGSIPTESLPCRKCVFNEQCESNWCWDKYKVCAGCGVWCYTCGNYAAGCQNCPSDPSTDPTQCECRNSNFPNNWVECTDGTDGMYTIDSSMIEELPDLSYNMKLSSTGGIAADDKFAIQMQCYHNKMRQAVGLEPLDWDDNLAKFAKEWSEYLCGERFCYMIHSRDSDRGFDAGENLYSFYSCQGIPQEEIPNLGQGAVESWYNEIGDYWYKGEGEHYRACEQDGAVGHFTQVMWESTTKVGCGFAFRSDGKKVLVSCSYTPSGNWGGQQAFDNEVYCKLKNWSENKENYGEISWCGDGSEPC